MMEIERSPSFTIKIANDFPLQITPLRWNKAGDMIYEVSSESKVHGRIFPTVGEGPFIVWATHDDIELQFVDQIGAAIEWHDN